MLRRASRALYNWKGGAAASIRINEVRSRLVFGFGCNLVALHAERSEIALRRGMRSQANGSRQIEMRLRRTIRKRRQEAGIALLIAIFILLLIGVVAIALVVS